MTQISGTYPKRLDVDEVRTASRIAVACRRFAGFVVLAAAGVVGLGGAAPLDAGPVQETSKALQVSREKKAATLAGFEFEKVVRRGPINEEPALLIAFHYSGGSAEESFENYDQLASPVRILVPIGRVPKRNGRSYFPVDYYDKDPAERFRIAKKTVDELANFVRAAEERFKRRAVVTGISQGGDVALLLAIFHPEIIEASFPLAAVIPEQLTTYRANPSRRRPIIALMQGELDPIVDVSTTRRLVRELQARLAISLATYPALGHDISAEMKADYTRLIDDALRKVSVIRIPRQN